MKAFFAGSFNPFTVGHADIVDRALAMFDGIVIGVGIHPDKTDAGERLSRLEAIRQLYAECSDRVQVVGYSSLTVDAARDNGCGVLLRGVRSVKDFEYERDLADTNRIVGGIDTVILLADPSLAVVSSSMVRELKRYGKDVSRFLPSIRKI